MADRMLKKKSASQQRVNGGDNCQENLYLEKDLLTKSTHFYVTFKEP